VTGELQVAVVLHHADELDVGDRPAIELAELRLRERAGELERSVPAEIVEHDGRAIANGADGIALAINDHETQQVLVDHPGILVPEGLNRLGRTRKAPTLAKHVILPAALDHRPVGAVAVHRDEHTAAARRNAVVAPSLLVEIVQHLLEGFDVLERAGLGYIAPVEQNVHAHVLHAFFVASPQHCKQVLDVAVHVAIRKQPDEVHRFTALLDAANELFPFFAFEDLAAVDRHLDTLGALIEDAPRSERVVPDLAVPHIVVARETYGRAMRRKPRGQRDPGKAIERGRPSEPNRIALIRCTAPHAIHDDDEHGSLNARKSRVLFELPIGHEAFLAQRPLAAHLTTAPGGKQSMLRP